MKNKIKFINLDKYKAIEIIGDLHGNISELKSIIPTTKEDVFYIFLGDYFDRGDEIIDTWWYLNSVKDKPNVILLKGNHDVYLKQYLYDKYNIENKSALRTIGILKNYDISDRSISKFYACLENYFAFTFKGQKYLTTHAGLPSFDESKIKYSKASVFTNGLLRYARKMDKIDKIYENNWKDGDPIQIHGHIKQKATKHSKNYIFDEKERILDKCLIQK